jgi:hypothetical protein
MATNCEWCGGLVSGYHHGQRFCSVVCGNAWYAEERKQALAWFRGLGMTPELRNGEQQQEREA